MQILCKASNEACDVHCGVCGQGFQVYWTSEQAAQKSKLRAEVLRTLCKQHTFTPLRAAHPSLGFSIDAHGGARSFFGAPILLEVGLAA